MFVNKHKIYHRAYHKSTEHDGTTLQNAGVTFDLTIKGQRLNMCKQKPLTYILTSLPSFQNGIILS